MFYGVQSLVQLAQAAPGAVPKCRVDDWPDFPIRGAYMYGAPRLAAPKWRPESLEWEEKLVDWMSQNKLNFGVVVDQAFYEEVPGLSEPEWWRCKST